MSYNIKLMGLEVKRDGKNIKGSDFPVEIKELDEYKGTFWCVGSAESPDRSNDIIRLDGWDLKNYASNPIGLWCHNYYANPQFKSLKVKKDKDTKQLIFNPQFDMNYEPARTTFNQYKNGFMNMFSVGFIPGEYKFIDEDNKWTSGIDFIKGHELLELSAVPVPAHPGAGIMRGIFDEVKSLIDLGYLPEFKFMEEKNQFWNPIDINLDAYKDPRMVSVGKGIKALSAASIDPNFKDAIVGYLFDKDEFDENRIKEWTVKNVHVKPLQKFYQVNFEKENEESKIVLSVIEGEEEKVIEIKATETCKCPKCGKTQKPEEGKSCSATKCSTCDVAMEDKASDADSDEDIDSEEEGCGGGKKPKKEIDFEESEYIEKDLVEKPYPNEHACRLKDPGDFDKFARKNCAQKHDDKCIDVIYGIKDGKSEIQALRYPKKSWTSEEAKSHCSSRKGSFEAAKSEENLVKEVNVKLSNEVTVKCSIDEKGDVDLTSIQLVDKSFMDELKVITEEHKKLLDDVKTLLEGLYNLNKTDKSETVIFTFNPLDEEKEVIPVSSDSLDKETEEKIIISDEDLDLGETLISKFDELLNDKINSINLLDE